MAIVTAWILFYLMIQSVSICESDMFWGGYLLVNVGIKAQTQRMGLETWGEALMRWEERLFRWSCKIRCLMGRLTQSHYKEQCVPLAHKPLPRFSGWTHFPGHQLSPSPSCLWAGPSLTSSFPLFWAFIPILMFLIHQYNEPMWKILSILLSLFSQTFQFCIPYGCYISQLSLKASCPWRQTTLNLYFLQLIT